MSATILRVRKMNHEAQRRMDEDIEENKELYEALADTPDEDS